jgi:hypothetical protein
LKRIRERVREGVVRLRGLDIGDEIGVEILAQLVEGRRTATEIVERIYGLQVSDEGFQSCYTRARRELRKLESRGLISRRLFGRDKPYRLTELAVTNLARIGGEERQLPLIPRSDLVAYLATLILSVPVGLQAVNGVQLAGAETVGLFGCFCFFVGFSFSRILLTLRRVF